MIKKYTHYSIDMEDNLLTMMYPDGDVFLRERNNMTLTALYNDVALVSIKIGGKIINFGKHYFWNAPVVIDVSAYYSKDDVNSIDITIIDGMGLTEEFTIPLSLTKHDCYSPFLEFVPERCGDAPYARIVPPNRMLWDGTKKSTSLLAAVRDSDRFSGYEYEMESVPYATYRPSDAWLTTAQKQEHLGETYRNTLPATGNLAELDSNGLPLWIEQGALRENIGLSYEEQRSYLSSRCRSKCIFVNYDGLTISNVNNSGSVRFSIFFYNSNKIVVKGRDYTGDVVLNNASNYPFLSLSFVSKDGSSITPSDFIGITSSALTNPEAGKSYRWVIENNEYNWVELTDEQLINERFFWSINGKNDAREVLNKQFEFGSKIDANLVLQKDLSPLTPPNPTPKFEVLQSVKRSVSIADGSMPYVYIRWKTPWGITVEHLFYLGSYSSDKADAKELESLNYYEELSHHVRVGSFYLDGIVQPYDLFYYKTLENAELVEMYFPSYAFKPNTYMPNGDDYVAIKVKSSDVTDAVVEGVTQKIITFKFELL